MPLRPRPLAPHRPDPAASPDAEAMVVAAGASFEKRRSHNSYNLVQLDMEAGQGTMFLRAWSDRRGGFWTKDVLTYKNVDDGEFIFPLSLPDGPDPKERKSRPSPVPLAVTKERYLTHLKDRYRYLDFRGMGVSDRCPCACPWSSCTSHSRREWSCPKGKPGAARCAWLDARRSPEEIEAIGQRVSEPTPVLDLLSEHDGLIVLGDPGAGKTTFLKYLALWLARGRER